MQFSDLRDKICEKGKKRRTKETRTGLREGTGNKRRTAERMTARGRKNTSEALLQCFLSAHDSQLTAGVRPERRSISECLLVLN